MTRDADLDTVEEEADDLLEAIEEGLRQRRFGSVVRLEVGTEMPGDLLEMLLAGLEIGQSEVQVIEGTLDLSVALQVANLPRPELRAPRWQPVTPARITASTSADAPNGDMFKVIAEGGLSGVEAVHGASANWMEWHGQFDTTLNRLVIRFANNDGPLHWFLRRNYPLAAFPLQYESKQEIAIDGIYAVDHTISFQSVKP